MGRSETVKATTGSDLVAYCNVAINFSVELLSVLQSVSISFSRFVRMDKNFRMVFLLHDESSAAFVREFSERQSRMLQFLNDLEQSAVQLDRMNTGAKISSVAGSSVGVVGGVLSIVGLALIPVTAGVSLGLTMAGVGLGVTSGVNSIVTTATETGVNHTQHKKASEVFKSFMEDVQILQDRLEEVTEREVSPAAVALVVGKMVCQAGAAGKGVDAIIDTASALKMLKTEEVVVSAGKAAVQEGKALRKLPMMAADIPDVGQAAIKGPLALSKSARAGLIAVNALFIGMDLFFICKDSISLSKGTKTLMSQIIRARAALWRSEMDSWQKIYDAIRDGKERSEKNCAVVKQPFYPEMQERRDADVCSDDEEELKEKQLRAQ